MLSGEGKLELTESAREFQKVSAPQSRRARSEGEEATGPVTPDIPLFPFVPPGTHDQPLCAYAAMRVRLAKASGMSSRSDGATVSNGLAVYPTCCATQSVGICSMAIL